MKFTFIRTGERAVYPVAALCRVLGVSRSVYYAWESRGPSASAKRRSQLGVKVRAAHKKSRGTHVDPADYVVEAESRFVARFNSAEVHERWKKVMNP